MNRLSDLGIEDEKEQLLARFSKEASDYLENTAPTKDALAEQDVWSWDYEALAYAYQKNHEWLRSMERASLRQFLCWISKSDLLPPVLSLRIKRLVKVTDKRQIVQKYHDARQLRRTFHLHVGPTNSGKTYNALKALAKAGTGIYAGPLRLLAHEVWERLNLGTVGGMEPGQGRECNLITGEERRVVSPSATLGSCTVEMLPLNKPLDVAVIDEIQLIATPDRGAAWSKAVMGLQAKEIHLCGEETVVPLLEKLITSMGDQVEVHRYERLTPFTISDKSLDGDLSKIQPGDCLVAFSRNRIFELKARIERTTGKKCAVVYGGLPPETRSEQARLFNDPDSGYDIMVASDAVGMGLNL